MKHGVYMCVLSVA